MKDICLITLPSYEYTYLRPLQKALRSFFKRKSVTIVELTLHIIEIEFRKISTSIINWWIFNPNGFILTIMRVKKQSFRHGEFQLAI